MVHFKISAVHFKLLAVHFILSTVHFKLLAVNFDHLMVHFKLTYPFTFNVRKILKKIMQQRSSFLVHLQNSQWHRSHSDWTERPEASKENLGLGGRSSFKEKYSLKEAPPILKKFHIKFFVNFHVA